MSELSSGPMSSAMAATPEQTSNVSLADVRSPVARRAAGHEHAVDAMQLLDDPQEWAAFSGPSTREPGLVESNLVVDGITCAACAVTIEQALRAVPGVVRADVSAASRRATVAWSPDVVKPSGWMGAIRKAGYVPLPANDASARAARLQESRTALWRWLVAGLCMMQVMMYAYPAYVALPGDLSMESERLLRWASWVLTLPVMLFSCGPFFRSALRDLVQRRVSMDLPVAIALVITFAVSTAGTFDPAGAFGREVYFDSLTMFVFFLLTGRWLELRLRDRTAGALEAMVNRMPDAVQRRRADGSFEAVVVRRLVVGDVIRVLPGEAIAADGVITQGSTLVDQALLTGESKPVSRAVGAPVIAGSFNLAGVIEVRVEKAGADTRFAAVLALVRNASATKPRLAQLADRIAKPFLIVVLLAAAAAAGYWWSAGAGHALMVAVAVLVVTCPCALSLATPTAMLAAAGNLARGGVLVRRLQALEALAAVDTVVFDKTGTLTRDGLRLGAVRVREGLSREQALAMAAALAGHSLHPVARALVQAAQQPGSAPSWHAEAVTEHAGQGMQGDLQPCDGTTPARSAWLGSSRFCGLPEADHHAGSTHLADASGWLASFTLHQDLRADAADTVAGLLSDGYRVHMVSGDQREAALQVAEPLGIASVWAGCSPDDKLAFLREQQAQGHRVAVIGDGLNDAPVLAGADVSFALGHAAPLAQSHADFVVLGGQLRRIGQSLQLARRTMRVVRQNLGWALAYNMACIPLAVVGWIPAWLAGLGMAASSLLVVVNALRLASGLEEGKD
ncbi:MAG: cation-translocating P-type ATPase [Rhodoferax sp.]|nr:cation-translocating P-type ATPase [Rhodoferax sp.]